MSTKGRDDASWYWSLLNADAKMLVSTVAKALYVGHRATSLWPTDRNGDVYSFRDIMLYVAMLSDRSSAYRRLTADQFNEVQERLEDFFWAENSSLPRFVNALDNVGVTFPSDEDVFAASFGALKLDLIDMVDYATEETFHRLDSRLSRQLQPASVSTHHILLASLGQCACCFFEPTPTATRAFGQSKSWNYFYSVRGAKAQPDVTEWLANSTLRVAKANGRLRIFVERGIGTFDEIESPASIARVFLPCNPPIVLKAELDEFEELINLSTAARENALQRFLESHSSFLRVLGFGSYFPQVRLHSRGANPFSLAPDFIVEQVVGRPHAIVEIKRAAERIRAGAERGRPAVAVSAALRQLEDYYDFFSDSTNRDWFAATYGAEVGEPDLVLIIGNEPLAKLGLPSIARTPILGRPVRLITYRDLANLARTQSIVISANTELE